jgi:hypothetical protein
MDYGDIIRLIIFGFIFLSFFSGLFGGKKDDEKTPKQQPKPAQQRPRPVRPTELSESGGPARPRPVVMAEPAGPVEVYTGEGMSRTEARREELHERFGGELKSRRRDQRPREPLERDIRDTERTLVEQDITDMPTIAEELDPERRPRRQRQLEAPRRQRYVEGGDILRHSLKDPATLERAFIVKEVLDRPLSLRDNR